MYCSSPDPSARQVQIAGRMGWGYGIAPVIIYLEISSWLELNVKHNRRYSDTKAMQRGRPWVEHRAGLGQKNRPSYFGQDRPQSFSRPQSFARMHSILVLSQSSLLRGFNVSAGPGVLKVQQQTVSSAYLAAPV